MLLSKSIRPWKRSLPMFCSVCKTHISCCRTPFLKGACTAALKWPLALYSWRDNQFVPRGRLTRPAPTKNENRRGPFSNCKMITHFVLMVLFVFWSFQTCDTVAFSVIKLNTNFSAAIMRPCPFYTLKVFQLFSSVLLSLYDQACLWPLIMAVVRSYIFSPKVYIPSCSALS